MCGIFFSIGFENLPASVIDSVTHRGPDDRGWNEFMSPKGPVIMAHRRLSIIDLSIDGHQPMSTQDGRFWISYNGEIYNYLEIRKELEALGHIFTTRTDTEVLLISYCQWGTECLHRFNGMFAFVIWDNKEKKFFAARDRFGIKPLYYYVDGEKLAFASEIKQFKGIKGWKSVLNQQLANEYLYRKLCDHRRETLYGKVFQILPGHFMEANCLTRQKIPTCWYKLENHINPLKKITDEEAIEGFSDLFEDSIRLRLRSDVPVGSCLSGGLDSSSIVSKLRALKGNNQEIHAFSSVFPSYSVDESHYIDELVREKNLISHKNFPSVEEFLEKIDLILYHQDLPFSGTSVFAQWKTFQSAKSNGIVVLLDGQGADESLLGYPGMLNGIIFDYAKKLDISSLWTFVKWQSQTNNQSIRKTALLAVQQRYNRLYTYLLRLKGCQTPYPDTSLNNIIEVCLKFFTCNLQTLLRYEDRNSMAASRESRLPFLDYRLVEFVLSLPASQRYRQSKTKWVLRESMRDINIDSILNRKDKIGFSTPEKNWSGKLSSVSSTSNFSDFIYNRWLKNEKIG